MSFSYTSSDFPFQPFAKIYSADLNQCLNDVKTYLNSAHYMTRYGATSGLAAGTANYVVYNDSSGDLTEAQYMPTAKGGLNANVTPAGVADTGKTLVVDAAGTGFQLSSASNGPLRLFNFYSFS